MNRWSNFPIKSEVIQEDFAEDHSEQEWNIGPKNCLALYIATIPEIEADIKPKVEPFDETSNVITHAELQEWCNQIEFQIEPDVKPKIEVDIKPKIEKSEGNEDINKGMEIVSSMNIPVATEIQAQYIY